MVANICSCDFKFVGAHPWTRGDAVGGVRFGCVTTSYPLGENDPAGVFVKTRVAELRAAGHEVEVIAAGPEGALLRDGGEPLGLRLPSSLFSGPGAPEVLESGGARAWLAAFGFTMRMVAAVRARLSAWDAVESHWLVPSTLAVVLAARRPPGSHPLIAPHTAIAHSGDVALLERVPFGAALARYLLARVDRVRTVSRNLRARLLGLCGPGFTCPPIEIAPMAIDPLFVRASVSSSLARVKPKKEPPIVLGVGRLVPIKGFDRLIFAVGRMPLVVRPSIVILGEGPERTRLVQLARALKVSLQLPGAVAPAEVSAWMARAALCVLPSRRLPNGRREGAPLVRREAQAMGVPVIASVDALDEEETTGDMTSNARALRIWRGDVESLTHLLEQALAVAPAT